MVNYVPAYLRPLSVTQTGNQSRVSQKAADVDSVQCTGYSEISFEQRDEVTYWDQEEIGMREDGVPRYQTVKNTEVVPHSERHWWILTDGLLEATDPPLREHADIFDFLIALNICTEDPVFFSQSPGQVRSGAFEMRNGALEFRSDLSIGNFAVGLSGLGEIPEQVEIKGNISEVYPKVREYRSKRLETDVDMDIRIALHLYDDALSSTLWTVIANLYYVFENVLFTGHEGKKDQIVSKNTELTLEEARSWREAVNRLKHPDEGSKNSVLDDEDLIVPSPQRMRSATNSVLKDALKV